MITRCLLICSHFRAFSCRGPPDCSKIVPPGTSRCNLKKSNQAHATRGETQRPKPDAGCDFSHLRLVVRRCGPLHLKSKKSLRRNATDTVLVSRYSCVTKVQIPKSAPVFTRKATKNAALTR